MGYDIRPISELNTFDYSITTQVQNANTVRKSLDEQFFLVEGDTITTYTLAEILVILDGPNWTPSED